jgi:transcriptional regulator of arginine metabolism
MQRVFRDSVVSYDYSENIIVIKTLPGAAQSIGSLIDALDSQYILGSVGGDDTVFIVVKPKQKVTEVMKYFRQILE